MLKLKKRLKLKNKYFPYSVQVYIRVSTFSQESTVQGRKVLCSKKTEITTPQSFAWFLEISQQFYIDSKNYLTVQISKSKYHTFNIILPNGAKLVKKHELHCFHTYKRNVSFWVGLAPTPRNLNKNTPQDPHVLSMSRIVDNTIVQFLPFHHFHIIYNRKYILDFHTLKTLKVIITTSLTSRDVLLRYTAWFASHQLIRTIIIEK